MKRSRLNSLLLALLCTSPSLAMAADNGGGLGGGLGFGGFWCRLLCDIRHGSCEIPSGDPEVPPLKDPFCEQRKADCKAGCGSGGGGSGGILIGDVPEGTRKHWLISPVMDAHCAVPASSPIG